MKTPTLEECETAIGTPAKEWAGRCFEIASAIVDAGLVPGGVAVYGHWLGDVHPHSIFADKHRAIPFIPHGWIWVEEESLVIDPTRWAFEACTPYIYVGEKPDLWDILPCENCGLVSDEHHDDDLDHCGDFTPPAWPYDEGGNQWRASVMKPPPKSDPSAEKALLKLARFVAAVVTALLGIDHACVDLSREEVTLPLTTAQIFWLANVPYEVFGRMYAGDVYAAISAANFVEFIPVDNRRRAARESGYAES